MSKEMVILEKCRVRLQQGLNFGVHYEGDDKLLDRIQTNLKRKRPRNTDKILLDCKKRFESSIKHYTYKTGDNQLLFEVQSVVQNITKH